MPTPRRPLATRSAGWTKALARGLAQRGVSPNVVSLAGVLAAVVAGMAFALAPGSTATTGAGWLLVAAAGVQLRLLCNLLDGMLAVEEGLKTATGDLYNDVPDRIADVVILVGAGYAARHQALGVELGWAAAVLAVLTAYVRTLGGALGVTQHFIGPMAKQHRMFTLTVATVIAAAELAWSLPVRALRVGLAVIVAGSIVTVVRRTRRIATGLGAR